MKQSNYRILLLVRCLSYLYNQKSHRERQIIIHGNHHDFNRILDELAYKLDISKKGIIATGYGNIIPLRTILWSASQRTLTPRLLKQFIRAEQLAFDTNTHQLLKHTDLKPLQLWHLINTHHNFSIQCLRQIANNLHVPTVSLVKAFERCGIQVIDRIQQLPVLIKPSNCRQALKRYLKCLAYLHQKPVRWIAEQLGMKYHTLIKIIKTKSKSDILIYLKKLSNIFQEVTIHSVAQILCNNPTPQHNIEQRLLRNTYDRKSIITYVNAYAMLNGVTMASLSKGLGKSRSYLITSIMSMNKSTLSFVLSEVAHMLNMPRHVVHEILQHRGVAHKQIIWPKHFYFKIHYQSLPFGYHFTSKYLQSSINSNKHAILQAVSANNSRKVILKFAALIGGWGQKFGFSITKFSRDNFSINNNKIKFLYKSQYYPIQSVNDWERIFRICHQQFTHIKAIRSLTQLKKSIYASYIYVNGISLKKYTQQFTRIKKLNDKHKHVFLCKFLHTGIRVVKSQDNRHKEFYRPTITFADVNYHQHPVLSEAIFNYTKTFVNLGQLQPGDTIKVLAMVKKTPDGYNLNRTSWAKLYQQKHEHDVPPVPHEIHALTGFAIENNKSGHYDFTTWGHNYGYVRFCKHRYQLWKQHQKGVAKHE